MSVVNLGKQHPVAYKQLVSLNEQAEEAVRQVDLDPLLAELVKIRISQINGCAFCLRMHTRDALGKGETSDRLAVVAAWWESQYFTSQERAALALAEQVTRLSVPDAHAWDDGSLTPAQASAVGWLAVVMNAWNRVAITSGYPVGP
ncbi:carboxymuconolactone decarboxylase family protein [Rhodococcus sp. NPDC058639]|uniref:carboxymuconolactone decarboxylase family protein n=1 Tax=Rhodococcus sp. NPDC058639 TaxID=3346570 RepID=UPI003667691B